MRFSFFFRAAIKGKQYGRPEDGQIEPPTSNQTRHDTGRRGRMEMGPRLRYKTVGRGCEPARKGRGGTVHNTRHTRGSHTQASRTLSRASHRDGPEGYRSHASTQSLALLRHPYAEDSLGLQGVRARNLTRRKSDLRSDTPAHPHRTTRKGKEKIGVAKIQTEVMETNQEGRQDMQGRWETVDKKLGVI